MRNLFLEWNLSKEVKEAIEKKGFEKPSPIQEKVIPLLLENKHDVIGQAQTGTGKTAAFGIPIIERTSENSSDIEAIILTPTRELAIQVSDELNSLKGRKKLHIYPIYGGQSIEIQLRKLKKGVNIVVGTPGRVIDHIKRGTMDLSKIKYFILDEADEMLNMGFIEDIEEIFKVLPENKRVLLFSATMPKEILNIAKKYLKEYKLVKVTSEKLTTDLTKQIYYEVPEHLKLDALCRILDVEKDFYGLIFCRTKKDVDDIANKLIERGYNAEGLHGDISQYQRERILGKFKNKVVNILVATDVAARGIDVNDLTHVINYSIPQDPESYVHRIGRTGRAGKSGTAITFITPYEFRRLNFIQKKTNSLIEKQSIPSFKEVISIKRNQIKETILQEAQEFANTETKRKELIENITQDLLKEKEPQLIINSLIAHLFGDELDNLSAVDKFNNSKKNKRLNDSKKGSNNFQRIFIALGKEQGYSKKKIVDLISENTDLENSSIKDVRVFDNFSFATVPTLDAQDLVDIFRKSGNNKRPLIEFAKN